MHRSAIGYVIMGIAGFRFFLVQEDVIAVVGVADADVQAAHGIRHVGHDYPLRLMPKSMQMNDADVRYYVLLQAKQQRFSLASNLLSFVALQHDLSFSDIPACMKHENACVMNVCFHDGVLLCGSSATALHAVSVEFVA